MLEYIAALFGFMSAAFAILAIRSWFDGEKYTIRLWLFFEDFRPQSVFRRWRRNAILFLSILDSRRHAIILTAVLVTLAPSISVTFQKYWSGFASETDIHILKEADARLFAIYNLSETESNPLNEGWDQVTFASLMQASQSRTCRDLVGSRFQNWEDDLRSWQEEPPYANEARFVEFKRSMPSLLRCTIMLTSGLEDRFRNDLQEVVIERPYLGSLAILATISTVGLLSAYVGFKVALRISNLLLWKTRYRAGLIWCVLIDLSAVYFVSLMTSLCLSVLLYLTYHAQFAFISANLSEIAISQSNLGWALALSASILALRDMLTLPGSGIFYSMFTYFGEFDVTKFHLTALLISTNARILRIGEFAPLSGQAIQMGFTVTLLSLLPTLCYTFFYAFGRLIPIIKRISAPIAEGIRRLADRNVQVFSFLSAFFALISSGAALIDTFLI